MAGGRGQCYFDAQGACFRLAQVLRDVDAHTANCLHLLQVNGHHTRHTIFIRWNTNGSPACQSARSMSKRPRHYMA